MKTAHIICSVKHLNRDYEHLQWLRLYFLGQNVRLLEDWINHSLTIRNNRPHFQSAPNFDYMRVATQSINEADTIVFLFCSRSTFVLTMLQYAVHIRKEIVVICSNAALLKDVEGNKDLMTVLTLTNYRHKMKGFL
jgi:hypothetical protein